jgi:hypothetical protein
MPKTITLLDLITAVHEFARTDAEVVATIVQLVNSGMMRRSRAHLATMVARFAWRPAWRHSPTPTRPPFRRWPSRSRLSSGRGGRRPLG